MLRRFWPDRKGMFTCTCHTYLTSCSSSGTYHGTLQFTPGWNTKISARETNYGTCIDYVLVTLGLIPWIKLANIQPSIEGSDHYPIFVDLHDEITTDTSEKLVLRDLMHIDVSSRDWRSNTGLCSKEADAYVKRSAELPPTAPADAQSPLAAAYDSINKQLQPVSVEEQSASKAPHLSLLGQPQSSAPSPILPTSTQASLKPSQESHERSHKRPRAGTSTAAGAPKPKMLKAGRSKLSSFFTKPTIAPTAPANANGPSSRAGSWSSEIIDFYEDSEETQPLLTITSEIRLPASSSWSAVFKPMLPRQPRFTLGPETGWK